MKNATPVVPDQIVCLHAVNGTRVWQAVVGGKLLAARWSCRGAALAGLAAAQRRPA